jgi:glycine cleavage system H lipoate-binding protein
MQGALELLQSAGVFTAGVLVRIGIFLAMLAALLLPAVLLALAIRAVERRRERRLGIREVGGVPFRPDVAYAPGHLWLRRREGGAVELGLDGLAQRLLPAVTAAELARPGTRVQAGEPVATLHGGGRALSIPAPFDGVVEGLNAAVLRDPALVKREGYDRGWLVLVAPARASDAACRSGEAAEGWLRAEAARWGRFVEGRLGFAAADGGTLVAPAPWLLGEDGWRALADAFLRGSDEK